MRVESTIANLLYAAIGDAVKESSIPDMPVQYPLRSFVPPNSGKYVEVVQIINNGENETWNEEKTHQGIVRLLLHWPANETGAIPMLEFADELASLIPKGSSFREETISVAISDNPDISSVVVDGSVIFVPISLRYTHFSF